MEMGGKLKHVTGTEKGTTLFEFAIVITLLLMLMFGIVDFARALYAYHFVANAAREASRYASVRSGFNTANCAALSGCPATTTTVTTYVQGLATGIGISNPGQINAAVTVQNPPGGSNCTTPQPGCVAQVTVSYPFSFIMPFLPKNTCSVSVPEPGFGGSICMWSTSQMVISQ